MTLPRFGTMLALSTLFVLGACRHGNDPDVQSPETVPGSAPRDDSVVDDVGNAPGGQDATPPPSDADPGGAPLDPTTPPEMEAPAAPDMPTQ
ncbi:MAG: hypothetical protein DIU78_010150 [Pseudomonadota bacterium]|nr:MAG: hypothetical protein DIU78_06835 [Pseudomonadota bacterium]